MRLACRRGAPAGIITAVAVAAWHGSFGGAFVFDDGGAILENTTIRQLWPPWPSLRPPGTGMPVTGRPLVNFSFALNWALSGSGAWSYHLFNLALHVLAGLALFGCIERTLRLGLGQGESAATDGRDGGSAFSARGVALVAALFWTVHPLQTAAVTYLSQRAEVLAGLCLLLTFYTFIRSTAVPGIAARRWRAASLACCLLGMASKETMAAAPLLVLLYDRTFVSGSFLEAWRRHRGFHLALAATWLLLGGLLFTSGDRGSSVGLHLGVSAWAYLLTQAGAIMHYLRLVVWPSPLVFDYGEGLVTSAWDVLPQLAMLAALAAWTVRACVRNRASGFLGVWFFAVLAPSSSLLPVVTQTMAEHRMYLALAVPAVVLARALMQRASSWRVGLAALLVVSLGAVTVRRNLDYRSEITLWQDTVAKRPGNPRAHYNLANALFHAGRTEAAIEHYRRALLLRPGHAEAHYNLANALAQSGERSSAIEHYRAALRLQPTDTLAMGNLAMVLVDSGRLEEAYPLFEEALRAGPASFNLHYNHGNALLRGGRMEAAIGSYRAALALAPGSARAHNNLGKALQLAGDTPAAERAFEEAVRLDPDLAEAQANLGDMLAQSGRLEAAARHYRASLQARPDQPTVLNNLGFALLLLDQPAGAVACFEEAVRLQPEHLRARLNLAGALARLGQASRAVVEYEAALRLHPDSVEAREGLDETRRRLGETAGKPTPAGLASPPRPAPLPPP